MAVAHARVPVRVLAYCAMPNHWHLLLWPERDGTLARFVGRLALIPTQRHHARRGGAGSGHLCQGRFKAFPAQADAHLLAVWRCIECNPLRADFVRRAEDRRRSSLRRRRFGEAAARRLLTDGPLPLPADRTAWVSGGAEAAAELEALRRCVARGRLSAPRRGWPMRPSGRGWRAPRARAAGRGDR